MSISIVGRITTLHLSLPPSLPSPLSPTPFFPPSHSLLPSLPLPSSLPPSLPPFLRNLCCDKYPEALPKLLQSVTWSNRSDVAQVSSIIIIIITIIFYMVHAGGHPTLNADIYMHNCGSCIKREGGGRERESNQAYMYIIDHFRFIC